MDNGQPDVDGFFRGTSWSLGLHCAISAGIGLVLFTARHQQVGARFHAALRDRGTKVAGLIPGRGFHLLSWILVIPDLGTRLGFDALIFSDGGSELLGAAEDLRVFLRPG